MPRPLNHAKKILDWEELEQAPNTRGAFSFLRTAAEVISIRRGVAHPEDALPIQEAAPQVTPTQIGDQAAKSEASASRSLNLRRCTLAQDGHSLGEAALYQMLWARGVQETEETRSVTMGWRMMQRLCGMTDKNCKRNMTSLIRKLAVEMVEAEDVHTRRGRRYRIHSYGNILARRRAAGLEWVTRDKSRRFVREDGSSLEESVSPELNGSDLTTVVVLAESDPIPCPTYSTTVVYMAPRTGVCKTPGTVVDTTPVLGSLLENEIRNKSSSTKEVQTVVEALGKEAFVADEQAAIQLLEQCREFSPEATAEEVAAIIHEKGAIMGSRRDVRNPVGFLLASVSSVFKGEGIKRFRMNMAAVREHEERRRREEQERNAEIHRWFQAERQRLLELLQDSGTPESRKLSARAMLADVENSLRGWDAQEDTQR